MATAHAVGCLQPTRLRREQGRFDRARITNRSHGVSIVSAPKIFSPFQVGGLALANRIIVAPMCQYSAEDGCMTDWHLIHLGQLAISGAAALTVEATAVLPEGRISYADVGLYSDACESAMRRVLDGVRRWSDIPLAIQLAHAGRKASTDLPWVGGAQIPVDHPKGWRPVAPSAVPFAPKDAAPMSMNADALTAVRAAFVSAAHRATGIGFDAIQLHGAHGYLLHEFLSPLSNRREDQYGGSLENRMRFPLEVFDAVRTAFPAGRPVTVRVSATDWAEGGWDLEQTIAFAQALEARGCDAINVSSGGLTHDQKIPVSPNYQVPLARAVKRATSMPVVAVGLITEPEQAEGVIATGDADLIALGRAFLYDPRWPWHAAAHFRHQIKVPPQYLRSEPRRFKDLFISQEGPSTP